MSQFNLETNPYKPPAATLETGNAPKKRAVWWKIYFWFMVASQSIYCVAILAAPEAMKVEPSDYFDAGFYVGVLLAVYGYVYYKRVFNRKTWQFFFPFILLWDIWSVIVNGDWEQWRQSGPVMLTVLVVFVVGLMIPQYIALFRYGFREQALWERGVNSGELTAR
jgi:hypothetical protein